MRFLIPLLLAISCQGATYYVSTNGTGDGSLGNPWSLQVALTNPVSGVVAGDTVNLLPGYYTPPNSNSSSMGAPQWEVKLSGAGGSLITWQPYLGTSNLNNVRIDRQWRFGANQWHRFKYLEFFDSFKGYNPTNGSFPSGPWLHFDDSLSGSTSNEWIGCFVHDVNNAWSGGAAGAVISDCIGIYVGLNTLEHVTYNTSTLFRNNIVGFYTQDALNFHQHAATIIGNVFFGGGQTVAAGKDMLLGGFDLTIAWNYTFNHLTNDVIKPGIRISPSADTVNVRSNVLVGVNCLDIDGDTTGSTLGFSYNVFHMPSGFQPYAIFSRESSAGTIVQDSNLYTAEPSSTVRFEDVATTRTFAQWQAASSLDASSLSTNAALSTNMVVVRPSVDTAKRCHVIAYNWTSNNTVSADLTGVLVAGDTYAVYSAQHYSLGPIQTGTWSGSAITLPMTNLSVAPVLYGTNWGLANPPLAMSPRFAAFIIQGEEGRLAKIGQGRKIRL